MAPVDNVIAREAIRDDPATATPDTVSGPTALFWMVCFALNAMAEPSGSVCNLGLEPQWVLRMSPFMMLFDGIHMMASWLVAYFKNGKSIRIATADTLLSRLTGANVIIESSRRSRLRQAMDEVPLVAPNVRSILAKDNTDEDAGDNAGDDQPLESLSDPKELEKAEAVVKDLISHSISREAPFHQFIYKNQHHDRDAALAALDALVTKATEAEVLLGQLIVSQDNPSQKEDIRRAFLPYKSKVAAVQELAMRIPTPRSVAKARVLVKDLTSQMGLRWFGFVLGVLPQLIKLFGSSGIPLVQVCGAMYLLPWVIFEGLLVVAKVCELDESESAWDEGDGSDSKRDDRARHNPVPDSPPRHEMYLMLLGIIGIAGHGVTMVNLMLDTAAATSRTKNLAATSALATPPLWINDFGAVTRWPLDIEGTTVLTCIGISILALSRLPFSVLLTRVTGGEEVLAHSRDLLIFVGVTVVYRYHIGFMRHHGLRQKMLILIRVLFICVPAAYHFLVLYDDDDTRLLSWADWLG
ncbi:hypothetical protein F5Y18DRAFT_78654 [Xylariaceae sp. FL1019]|nr:hypothetical protein F5Y18DRAFT_78654 [Xylariaceae sp. FL1019]